MKFTHQLNSNNYIAMDRYQIEAHTGPLYEILLPNYPVKPYFDLDRSVEHYNKNQFEVETNIIIENAKTELCNLYGRQDIEWAVESNSGEEANGKQKLSVHMVAQNLQAVLPMALKNKLIEHGEFTSPIDLSIYRNGISKFRVGGFPKDNSIRTPIIHSGTKLSFLLTNSYPSDAIYEKSDNIKENKIVGLKLKKNKKNKNKEMNKDFCPTFSKSSVGPELQQLLDLIPADGYEDYIKVGMFMRANQYSILDWGKWSSKSEKFDASEVEYKWSTFSKKSKITIKSIDFMARKNLNEYLTVFKIKEVDELFSDFSDDECSHFLAEHVYKDTLKIYDRKKGDCWIYNEAIKLWEDSSVKCLKTEVNILLKKMLKRLFIINSEKLNKVLHSNESEIERLNVQKGIYQKSKKTLSDFTFCGKVVGFLGMEPSLVDKSFTEKLSLHRNLLAVKNGCVELDTGKLREREFSDYFTTAIKTAYNPEANSIEFESFIKDMFSHPDLVDSKSLIDFIKVALGYTITKETKEQVMFLANGSGSNGKGVLANCLLKTLENNVVNSDGALLDKKVLESANSASPALMALENKTLSIINEMEEGVSMGALFKKLVDSGSITGRNLHQSNRTFEITHKLLIFCNDAPVIPTTDESFPRRIVSLPCKNSYKNKSECIGNDKIKDTGLEERLIGNKEGILKYLVEGAKQYYKKGGLGDLPEDVKLFNKELLDENDWKEGLEFTGDDNDEISSRDMMAYLQSLGFMKNAIRLQKKYVNKLLYLGAIQRQRGMWLRVKFLSNEEDDFSECFSE
jgi:P4 family phage/plasmid primase-like protien